VLSLTQLLCLVAINFGDCDLRQPVILEHRQQVVAEGPFVVTDCPCAQLAAPPVEPIRGEPVEGRDPAFLGCAQGLVATGAGSVEPQA
jgi:hypothetical protein